LLTTCLNRLLVLFHDIHTLDHDSILLGDNPQHFTGYALVFTGDNVNRIAFLNPLHPDSLPLGD
jgi:hypothetical protein